MKRLSSFLVILTLLTGSSLYAQNVQSVWITGDKTIDKYSESWAEGNNRLDATIMGNGYYKAVKTGLGEFTFGIDKYRTTADLKEGDYWLVTLPLEKDLEKGTYVEIDFTMVSQPNSPKYYIVEVLDGKRWKSNTSDLRTAQEDGRVKYTVKCSGYGDGATDQHSMALQTFRLSKGAKGSLQFRIRAVGPYTCWGSEAQPSDKNWSSFVDGPSSAMHARVLGTSVPKDTTRLLCIGNSFTYVNGASWMLKQIAWSQGHYLYTDVAQKGGQTLGQHIHLGITADAIERGGYEYVFLQDLSLSCARVGKDRFRYQDIINNAGIISRWIRKKSPSAKIFYENTWAYAANNYGGFGDYKSFDESAIKGSRIISSEIGATISPIADAFAITRQERPDISLYYTDNHHQSEYGAYLKACVNYLMLFGGQFSESADACGLDPEKTAYLRQAAQRAVRQ